MAHLVDRCLYVEALEEWNPTYGTFDHDLESVFLAGGITGCPDWQTDMVSLLAGSPVVVLNPRRKNFPIGDPNAAQEQIAWEYRHLRKADRILFWFSAATLNPIVLYELGAWSVTTK